MLVDVLSITIFIYYSSQINNSGFLSSLVRHLLLGNKKIQLLLVPHQL